MSRFSLVTGLVIPVLCALSGCHVVDYRFQPLSHHPDWDPVLGSCYICGTCGGDCEGHTPCSYAKHLMTCAAGCGEIYWGEWLSDPPDCCDPCDNCGNWIGPQPCGPTIHDSFTASLYHFFGYRFADCGCGVADCGCGDVEGVYGYTDVFAEETLPVAPQKIQVRAAPHAEPVAPPTPIPAERAAQRPNSNLLWLTRPNSMR